MLGVKGKALGGAEGRPPFSFVHICRLSQSRPYHLTEHIQTVNIQKSRSLTGQPVFVATIYGLPKLLRTPLSLF